MIEPQKQILLKIMNCILKQEEEDDDDKEEQIGYTKKNKPQQETLNGTFL